MAFHMNFSWVKEHPKTAAIVIIGGAFVVYEWYKSRQTSSSISAVSNNPGGVSDAVYQAELQAASQANSIQAQSQATADQAQYAMNSAAETNAANYQLANLNATTSTTQQVNAITGQENLQAGQLSTQQTLGLAQLGEQAFQTASNNSLALNQSQITAATTLGLSQQQTQANVAIAGINATQNTNIAGINAGAETTIAQYNSQTQLGIAQYNANVNIAQSNNAASVAKTQSGNNLIGGVVGGILGGIF